MCCFQISEEDDIGTNKGLISSGEGFDCPTKCSGTWKVGGKYAWAEDPTLRVIKEGD